MQIEIYCTKCNKKTIHTLINITDNKLDDNPTKWLCNECAAMYHEGYLLFESHKEHEITTDRKFKQTIKNESNNEKHDN